MGKGDVRHAQPVSHSVGPHEHQAFEQSLGGSASPIFRIADIRTRSQRARNGRLFTELGALGSGTGRINMTDRSSCDTNHGPRG